ncbi:MAG: isoprenyl transferase [Meiothermus sp.]|uniref:isoprenyl transferase n=1 Tax=Meiothermus sp. TaxID=1955249 RepID=UPI0025F174F2|nr:isoprenyl transferase [Meiothermus sp.]MCS7058980.1 isoprenyl transferase [Meiothermus sp.]MCS7195590.1 isoprenyl transferase [Meiothermus sp.]MCX7739747.1 isoprenyl transferase [Meiothermus sp.]MDW8091464.1 isoprenyl transferase [Meiothermus sp.]MDW8480335.1 isoprenyl transferase [Meiothermus sp.]
MAPTSPVRAPKTSLRKRLVKLAEVLLKPLYWWYEQRIEAEVRQGQLPKHLGLILDGNRRFARELGLPGHEGHEFGVQKAYEVLEWCLELGIPTVTIWVFSTDNWKRSPAEVETLMGLFVREAKRMAQDPRIHANEVRVRVIGRHDRFPPKVLEALEELERATAHHSGMLLQIAMGYGGREEIVDAVKSLLLEAAQTGKSPEELAEELDLQHISERLYTAGVPDPDFIIRTSGEIRLSGFLLWQSAYSEYYFFDAFWPAFRRLDFLRAVRDYQRRERRFGH